MSINLLNEGDLNKYLTSVVYTEGEVPHWVSENSSESQKNLQNPDWVKQNRDDVVKAILLQYFKKRIREYLSANSEASYLEPVKQNDENLPDWCKRALSENKPVFRFNQSKISTDLQEKISSVRDYLYSMADRYVLDTTQLAHKTEKNSKIRLDYLKSTNEYSTFENVLAVANLWHEKLAKNTAKVRKDEAFYKKSLEGTRFIMELPNNTFAYELLTLQALDFEGDNMGNCVGSGYYDKGVLNGTTKIYSIRDEKGEPHVTIEVRRWEKCDHTGEVGTVVQCEGRQNKKPIAKCFDGILALINKMNWDINNDIRSIGILQMDRKCYSLSKLVDGSEKIPEIIEGDVSLSFMDLTELPDFSNVFVKGSFNCEYNKLTSLKGSPKKVGKDFCCAKNYLTNLKGCPQEVDGDFSCADNQLTSLEGVPQKIGGSFYCCYNKLTSLKGAPQNVGKDFSFGNNQLTSLEGIPQKIKGDFDCSNNKLESLKGGPKEVGGSFFCDHNKLTSLNGAPQKVGEEFKCENNPLTNYDDAPKSVRSFLKLISTLNENSQD